MYEYMSDKSIPVRVFVRKTQISAVIAGIGIGLAVVFLWSIEVGFGFMAGVAISVVNFQLMAVDAFELVDKAPKKARSFIIGRYALRYAIMFGFLVVIATRTDLNILATFIGLFFVQIRLFAGHVMHAARVGDRIFKGQR